MKSLKILIAASLIMLSIPLFAAPKIQVKSAHQGCEYNAAICILVRPAEGTDSFSPAEVTFEAGYISETRGENQTYTQKLNKDHFIWLNEDAQDIKNDRITSVWMEIKSINGQPMQNCGITYNTDPLQNHWGTISIYQLDNKYICNTSK